MSGVIALVVVREGALPLGAVEAVLESEGHVLLIGTGVGAAVAELATHGVVHTIRTHTIPTDDFGQLAVAAAADLLDHQIVVCPASPDGRDLAPRLAFIRSEPLFAGAVRVSRSRVTVVRASGHVGEDFTPPARFVATLIPNTRGLEHRHEHTNVESAKVTDIPARQRTGFPVTTVAIDPPDPATMDLTEAKRIVAGGQGLGSTTGFRELNRFGSAIGASLGGTRVASDAGWIPFERQIGTTGVIVSPDLYLAFGISGATQHTTGLGDPDHVVSVNRDPSCPMMAMADLAIVADANDVIDSLNQRVDQRRNEHLMKEGTNP